VKPALKDPDFDVMTEVDIKLKEELRNVENEST